MATASYIEDKNIENVSVLNDNDLGRLGYYTWSGASDLYISTNKDSLHLGINQLIAYLPIANANATLTVHNDCPYAIAFCMMRFVPEENSGSLKVTRVSANSSASIGTISTAWAYLMIALKVLQ